MPISPDATVNWLGILTEENRFGGFLFKLLRCCAYALWIKLSYMQVGECNAQVCKKKHCNAAAQAAAVFFFVYVCARSAGKYS